MKWYIGDLLHTNKKYPDFLPIDRYHFLRNMNKNMIFYITTEVDVEDYKLRIWFDATEETKYFKIEE